MENQKKSSESNDSPDLVARKMLAKTYDQLEQKDMSKEAFVNQCMGVLHDKVNNKSPLILPN